MQDVEEWTKSVMLSVIADKLVVWGKADLTIDVLEKLTKEELEYTFLNFAGSHYTSKNDRTTRLYEFDFKMLEKMTDEEVMSMIVSRKRE